MMMTRTLFIILAVLLCLTPLASWGQTFERDCDEATWNTLQRIKAEVDNGMGYSSLHELEGINSELYKHQQENMESLSEAFVLSSSTLAELLVMQGEYYKADSVLNVYNVTTRMLSGYDLSNVAFYETDLATTLLSIKDEKKQLYPFRQYLYTQGFLYYYMSNLELAKKSLEDAKDLFVVNNDTSSVDFLKCLLLLSSIYAEEGDIVLSQLYYDMAAEVFHRLDYDKRYDYLRADLYYFSGIINQELGREDAALRDWRETLRICQDSHFDNMETCVNAVCCLMSNERGEEYLLLAREILLQLEQPFLKMNLLTLLLDRIDVTNDDFLALFSQWDSVVTECYRQSSFHFSTMELESNWTNKALTTLLVDNIMAYKHSNTDIVGKAYNNVMFAKSFFVKRKMLLDRFKIESYDEVGKLLSQQNDATTSSAYKITLSQIEKAIIEEYQFQWSAGIEKISPRWQQVEQSLGDDGDDVAIEFTFLVDSLASEQAQAFLYAYVIRKNCVPRTIKLCKLSEFTDYFAEIANVNNDFLDEEERDQRLCQLVNDMYNDTSKVYSKLWKPIEDSGVLVGAKNIFYSPCGDVNKINLEALCTGKKKKEKVAGKTIESAERLMDLYTFREILSTDEITDLKNKDKTPLSIHSALIYGYIDYGTSPEDMIAEARLAHRCYGWRATREQGFGRLPATEVEANTVKMILESPDRTIQVLMDKKASEESLKGISKHAPDVIHIATHGLFMSNNADRQMSALASRKGITKKNDEMIYNFLAFSGINNAWKGNPVSGPEDGIVTAEEVSWLDLRGCKLVVLSACETGLGTADLVDGVFGLQRGFKLAGADKIVMSLWTVNDVATSELMKAFYQYLINGKDGRVLSCHEALKEAKLYMISLGYSPYYWAGFVMLE